MATAAREALVGPGETRHLCLVPPGPLSRTLTESTLKTEGEKYVRVHVDASLKSDS